MRVVDGHIEGYIEMQPNLIGNLAFQILHGGVAATLLDSIGELWQWNTYIAVQLPKL